MSPQPAHPTTQTWVDVEGRTLKLTNLEKVLYPETGTTKAEVLSYYAAIAPVLLPQLRDRAVTRIRWPHGVGQQSFFEKNAPAGTPSWVRTAQLPSNTFPVVEDLATLTWLVNLAALELHVHQWTVTRTGRVRGADRLVIDLDPGEGAGLQECSQVALLAQEVLADAGLDARPVTSGSKGLHVYAALPRRRGPDEVTALAHQIADVLVERAPQLVTATMTKARRVNKVFVDWSQNSGSKTTVSPYSLRGTRRPQVATPVTWAEVSASAEDPLALEQFAPDQVLARVDELGDLLH